MSHAVLYAQQREEDEESTDHAMRAHRIDFDAALLAVLSWLHTRVTDIINNTRCVDNDKHGDDMFVTSCLHRVEKELDNMAKATVSGKWTNEYVKVLKACNVMLVRTGEDVSKERPHRGVRRVRHRGTRLLRRGVRRRHTHD